MEGLALEGVRTLASGRSLLSLKPLGTVRLSVLNPVNLDYGGKNLGLTGVNNSLSLQPIKAVENSTASLLTDCTAVISGTLYSFFFGSLLGLLSVYAS